MEAERAYLAGVAARLAEILGDALVGVYAGGAAAAPAVDSAFELNLNTGRGMAFRAEREPAEGERHWFAIERSVLARHGVPLLGPAPSEVFGELPPEALRPALAELVRWYTRNDPESEDAVLNAGRALLFSRAGVWLPKPALRQWAAEQDAANADVLGAAIAELEAA